MEKDLCRRLARYLCETEGHNWQKIGTVKRAYYIHLADGLLERLTKSDLEEIKRNAHE